MKTYKVTYNYGTTYWTDTIECDEIRTYNNMVEFVKQEIVILAVSVYQLCSYELK